MKKKCKLCRGETPPDMNICYTCENITDERGRYFWICGVCENIGMVKKRVYTWICSQCWEDGIRADEK